MANKLIALLFFCFLFTQCKNKQEVKKENNFKLYIQLLKIINEKEFAFRFKDTTINYESDNITQSKENVIYLINRKYDIICVKSDFDAFAYIFLYDRVIKELFAIRTFRIEEIKYNEECNTLNISNDYRNDILFLDKKIDIGFWKERYSGDSIRLYFKDSKNCSIDIYEEHFGLFATFKKHLTIFTVKLLNTPLMYIDGIDKRVFADSLEYFKVNKLEDF